MTHMTEQIGDLIVSIYKETKTKTERNLKRYGIGMGQLQILMLFYTNLEKSYSQNDFVNLLNIDKGNISRSVKKLIDKGYLKHDSERSNQILLTGEGLELKKVIITSFIMQHQSMIVGIDEVELENTVKTLSKISSNLKKNNLKL